MIKNLDQFTRRMDQISQKIDANLEKNVRKTALVMLRDITVVTPVDTGRLRANTNVGLGSSNLTDGPGVGPKGAGSKNAGVASRLALQRGEATIRQHQPGQSIHITNPTEYAQYVEEGTAMQEGKHFFKRGIQSGIAALRKAKILE